MEDQREIIILASVAVYMVFCLIVGLWAMRRTHSASDFFVAGKSLGPVVVALAIFSSALSGFGFIGGPGLFYGTGLSAIYIAIGVLMGYTMGFFLIARRIRLVAEYRPCLSLPDVVEARYNHRGVTFLTALTILFGVLGYLATQILAMALVMQSILAQTDMFADVGVVACMLVSTAVLIFYCVTGGIIASVYTDVVQGTIMIVSGLLIFWTAATVFDGGFSDASRIIMADNLGSALPFGALGALASVGWFFVFGMGVAGQPHVITKMMMTRRVADVRTIFPLTVLGYAFATLLWVSIGLVMRAAAIDGSIEPLTNPDQAAPMFLSVFAHPLLAGVVFAGLFAAIMSTTDAFLNIGVAALVHDMPKVFTGRPLSPELLWARVTTVLLSLVAMAFALFSFFYSEQVVALLGAFGWSTFGAVVVPVVAIGLNWERAHPWAAIAAICASLSVNLGIELTLLEFPLGLGSGYVSFLVSIILFIALSFMLRPVRLDPQMREVMRH
ncbi:MAG: hypothetical protein AAF311_03980 [Pseudomonadota bacterium]